MTKQKFRTLKRFLCNPGRPTSILSTSPAHLNCLCSLLLVCRSPSSRNLGREEEEEEEEEGCRSPSFRNLASRVKNREEVEERLQEVGIKAMLRGRANWGLRPGLERLDVAWFSSSCSCCAIRPSWGEGEGEGEG